MKFEMSKFLGSSSLELPPIMALPDKTFSEIQALILHYVLTNPNKSSTTYSALLRSLLLIEFTLRQRSVNGVANFAHLKASDLNCATQLAADSCSSRASVSPELGRIALVNLEIVTSVSVKNWVDAAYRKSQREYNQSSRMLGSNISNKLPNMQAIVASATYFSNQPWITKGEDPSYLDEDTRNVIVSCVLAILSLTPCRYQEIIKNLPVNCLIRRKESNHIEVLGFHWYSDKTDMTHVKWVPYTPSGTFESVIEEAVARLTHVTGDARALLRTWDSEHPTFNEKEYQKAKEENRLPAGWPWYEPKLRLRYSDAMFVTLRYQTNTIKHTISNRVDIITKSNFRDWLRTKRGRNSWTGEPLLAKGFFERIGQESIDFDVESCNTHAFRHMVNTAARLGGMSEFDVNMWSHRKNFGQGKVYNHTTGEQRRNLILNGDYKSKHLSPEERLEHINHRIPMTRKNLGMRFELIGNSYGGFTFNHPLGSCIHNYVESPCLRSMDCVMCPENLHCKGDKRTLKNLKEELEQANLFLDLAKSNRDKRAALRFETRSEVLSSLVEILGDNSPLAEGDLVILSPHQTPKAGLLERARLAAEQLVKNQLEIAQTHNQTKANIGVVRKLPIIENGSINGIVNATKEIHTVIDELLLGFGDED
ncbi:MAG: hypothetical protein Q7L07_17030 [Pseudohongiella sp.]|nr:hypothetical protein [Pseudohongiella sp.]